MKRLLLFLALCLPIYLFAQGFGSFSHDQPYLAKDLVSSSSDVSCNGEVFPTITSGSIVARWDPHISGTNDGDLVVTLQDTWTNVFNLIATNATTGPYWTNNPSTINNRGWLQFDCSTGSIMRTNIVTTYSQPNTYFLVINNVDALCAPSDSRIFSNSDGNTALFTYNIGGVWFFYSGSTALTWGAGAGPPSSTTWQVYIFRQNGASSSVKAGAWAGVSGDTGAVNGKGMVVGAAFDNSMKHRLQLGYFLWVNGNVSGTDETNVVRWIANCFGVPSNYGP